MIINTVGPNRSIDFTEQLLLMPNLPIDLTEQLLRHLKFIEASCRAYDQDFVEEALRIAVSLRVLFHDTKNSTSLLTHLERKNSINIISTIGLGKTDQQLGNSMVYYIPVMITPSGVTPSLGRGFRTRVVTVDAWWQPCFFHLSGKSQVRHLRGSLQE